MHVIRKKIPEGYSHWRESSELGDYTLAGPREVGVDLIIYWYADGGYDGSGYALLRKDDKWLLESLSHCSCSGPLESYTLNFARAQPLAELKARVSEDLMKDVAELFTEAETLVSRYSFVGVQS